MTISAFIAKLELDYATKHNMLIPATISTLTCGDMFITTLTIEQVGDVFLVTETCEADDIGDFKSPSVCYFGSLESAHHYVDFRAADVP